MTFLGWESQPPPRIHEEKVDGWRVLAYKDAAGVRLVSRNAKNLTIQSARQRDCCAHISTRRRRGKSAEYLARRLWPTNY